MRLRRRAIVVGLLVALVGAGVVYGTSRLIGGETVLYLASDDPGPDPFTEPAVFTSDVPPSTTTAPFVAPTDPAASPTGTPSPGASPTGTPSPGASPATTTTLAPSPDPFATTTFPGSVELAEPLFPGAAQGDCDVDGLIDFLNADEELNAAWTGVLNIDPAQFEDYIRTLTPVVLSRDARVTLYSYREGEAQEYQAILAEGNAALVDSVGDLVVRCYSGSPVTEPRQIQYRCEGCPEDYTPPPPCEQTCYPEPTTTTTTFAPTTTTSTTLAGQSTTTTRRSTASTTRAAGGATTTARPGGAVTTRPGGATTTRPPATTTTTAPPATTAPTTTTAAICLGELCVPLN